MFDMYCRVCMLVIVVQKQRKINECPQQVIPLIVLVPSLFLVYTNCLMSGFELGVD